MITRRGLLGGLGLVPVFGSRGPARRERRVSYTTIPPIPITAAADTTGQNPGNYTGVLSTSNQNLSNLTRFECYKITVDGPIGFGVSIYIDNKKWDHTAQGWQNAWDPNQAMPLQSGQTIYLFWNAADNLTPVPTATFWFRYDTSVPQTG